MKGTDTHLSKKHHGAVKKKFIEIEHKFTGFKAFG